ncbi:hypothetical protein FQZ97_1207880 [compost metagenome]
MLRGVERRVPVVQFQRARGLVQPDVAAQRAEDVQDLADVRDVGHAMQPQRLVGQQGGAQHG